MAALEAQKAELAEHNATMQEVNEKVPYQLGNIGTEKFSAPDNRDEAEKKT